MVGWNPPCFNGNLRTKQTGGLQVRSCTNMCAPALSVSIANQILFLRPSKGGFTGERNWFPRPGSVHLLETESSVWVKARLMVLNEDSLSVTHFAITPFRHSMYTYYWDVWVRAMLISLNEFGLSTYVIIKKRWIGGFQDSRINHTLITCIYLFCIGTWKTNVYVYPRLLLMCLCAPMSVDLRIRCIKTFYQTHVLARVAARLDHAECRMLRRHEGLELSYCLASTVICGVQLR